MVDDEDTIELPRKLCCSTNMDEIIEWTFPNLASNYDNTKWMGDRAILAPHIKTVEEANAAVSRKFPGEEWVCVSAAAIISDNLDDIASVPTEYLNACVMKGLPPHELRLKRGMPITLLRSLNPSERLCTGTRLVVECVRNRILLQAKVIATGETVLIPRIPVTIHDDETLPTRIPFKWQRRQFPVRVAFAMTLDESQGKTFQRVTIDLREPVFARGQLHVGMACADSIRFAVKDYHNTKTRKFLFKEPLH